MLRFGKKIFGTALRSYGYMGLRYQSVFYFCNQQKTLNPTYTKIRQAFQKGKTSPQYQQQMSKAMRQALSKYDYPQAINLQLFHLSLLKQSQGQKSQNYRSQLREITRFCINRLQFQTAAMLVEELRRIQSEIGDVGPLDLVSTLYLQGYIYMELNRLDDSKKCLYQCLELKHVREAPEVYFKIFSQLGRVHARAGEKEKALQKIQKCQQILSKRQYDPNSPPMILVMDLQDVFHLAQITSSMNQKALAQKYLQKYQQKMQKASNLKDPMYIQFLERKSKIYFNLKQFQKSIQLLNEAAELSDELGKVDPNFVENGKIMRNIVESIKREYMKK